MINKYKLTITVMMNVLFISLFIAIFFFTYGSYIEHKIVESQMEILSNDIVNSVKILGKNVNDTIKQQINELEPPNLKEADKAVELSNNEVKKKAIIANIFFTIFVVISIFFLYKYSQKNFNMKTIFIQNLILLLFVAITEFSFLTFFAADFVSINTNNIKYNIIDNLQ